MIPLKLIYKKSFFGRRHRLIWRANYICNAIIDTFDLRRNATIVDAGCAVGEYVARFNELGYDAIGIEGSSEAFDFVQSEHIYNLDLRKPIFLSPEKAINHDLCISFEVAEHIEEEYSDIYVDNLCRFSDRILLTAAPPGQKGHFHVNCQPKPYWIKKFKERGYERNRNLEEKFKTSFPISIKAKKEIGGYLRNTIVFIKEI